MSESDSHKRAKRKASGKTESQISGRRRLDSASRLREVVIAID